MTTSAFNKFNDFTAQLVSATHNFSSNTFKVALSNTAPVSTNTILSNITQISAGNGYTSGGTATTISLANATGTETVSGTQTVFTASGGSIGPFRYAVLYNDTATNKNLVGYFDYGAALTLTDGDTFTVKFSNATPGAILTVV